MMSWPRSRPADSLHHSPSPRLYPLVGALFGAVREALPTGPGMGAGAHGSGWSGMARGGKQVWPVRSGMSKRDGYQELACGRFAGG